MVSPLDKPLVLLEYFLHALFGEVSFWLKSIGANELSFALSSRPPRVARFRLMAGGAVPKARQPRGHGGRAVGKGMLFIPCLTPMHLMLAALWQGELVDALGAVAEEVGFWSPSPETNRRRYHCLTHCLLGGVQSKILLEKPFIPKISIVIFANAMTRSEILQTLAAHRDELTRMGVKTMAVFGSVARDEARLDSDVDILVEFQGPATFNGYMDLKFFLEDLLGRSVDLVTRKSVRPKLKTLIEGEALYVQGLSAVS